MTTNENSNGNTDASQEGNRPEGASDAAGGYTAGEVDALMGRLVSGCATPGDVVRWLSLLG